MTPEREAIISKDIKILLEELRSGKLDPLQVLEAYQAKALLADKDINAVCDFITEATSWAKSLKAERSEYSNIFEYSNISGRIFDIRIRI